MAVSVGGVAVTVCMPTESVLVEQPALDGRLSEVETHAIERDVQLSEAVLNGLVVVVVSQLGGGGGRSRSVVVVSFPAGRGGRLRSVVVVVVGRLVWWSSPAPSSSW